MQRQFVHPALEDMTLESLLYALADPTRLTIVINLHIAGKAINCSEASPSGLPKSTLSHHYKVLRESGLVKSERKGTEVLNELRFQEINKKFPGVLETIFLSASKKSN